MVASGHREASGSPDVGVGVGTGGWALQPATSTRLSTSPYHLRMGPTPPLSRSDAPERVAVPETPTAPGEWTPRAPPTVRTETSVELDLHGGPVLRHDLDLHAHGGEL